MAIRIAIANGNWSAPTTWTGGIIPTLGDDVNAANFAVTINQNINVGSLYSTGSGYFTPTFVSTSIICTGAGIVVGAWTGAGSFSILNFNGAYTGITVTSKITGGALGNGIAVLIQGTSNITFIGDIIGGTNATGYAINNTAGGTINIVGNVYGNISPAVRNPAATTVNITGNILGGSATTGYGVSNTLAGVTNVTGNITGGVANGFLSTGTGLVTCVGTVTASDSAAAINTGGTVRLSTPCINSFNFDAVDCVNTSIYASSPAKWSYRTENQTTNYKIIYSAGIALGNPAEANVRSGITYGQSSELTGSLIVPEQSNVLAGVPNDNSVGTYYKTASEITSEVLTALLTNPEFSTPGSFGALIKENLDVEFSGIQGNTNLIPAIV
jgi:hypothetical protein